MNARFVEETVPYNGAELRSGWIEERFGLRGDSVVAFHGPCSVRGEDLVDLEDLAAGKTVEGENMLHFIAEVSGVGLPGIAFAQRLLCIIAGREVERACGPEGGCTVLRDGDDLYVGDGKLSVSIATVSPESGVPRKGLIHLGLNIDTAGVPVRAACLEDLGVDYRRLAPVILSEFVREIEGGLHAADKVRRVP